MPAERLPMRQIRELLRLRFSSGLSQRAIGHSLGLSQAAVSEYLSRARCAGVTWPLPETLDDAQLEARLFPPPPRTPNRSAADARSWLGASRAAPAGCDAGAAVGGVPGQHARRVRLFLVLRSVQGLGRPAEADPAPDPCCRREAVCRLCRSHGRGDRQSQWRDRHGADLCRHARRVELHPSLRWGRLYAEAVWSQALPDWIAAHVRAFAYFDGAARQTVSDNLKAGITKACFYEPMVNRTYADMARHYGTAIVPARPYKPRDKAKVEVAVQVIGRWILARLRHRQFFSLTELNRAIRALLDELNDRPMRGWGVSRRALYQQLDQPALVRLPAVPYEYAEWKRCRVGLDYHVEIAKHYYSVPHRLLRQEVEARITAATVEIFHRGKRVASHRRSLLPHRPSTVAEHMPSAHRRYRDWTHERIRREAEAVGPDTAVLVDVILRSRPHPEQGFRSCIGILGLVKRFGAGRVEIACARALALGTRSYSSVAAILKNAQDRTPNSVPTDAPLLIHENIRGPGYYH